MNELYEMNPTLLSKLTVVIPTYNRQNYAVRNMRFWSGQGVTVHVMDGSDAPLSAHQLAGIDSNIHYHHKSCTFEERLEIAASYINTEYAMLCGDDEFQAPNGLIACIKFLEANNDYTSCCGRCVAFSVQKSKIELFPIKTGHATHFVNQQSASERIHYHISNFMTTTIYGVHRRDSFKFCISGMPKNFSSPYVAETTFELLSAIYGKSAILSNMSWIRSSENKPVQKNDYDRKYYLSHWYDDPSKVEEVEKYYFNLKQIIFPLFPIDERENIWKAACSALKIRINNDRSALTDQTSKPSLLILLKSFMYLRINRHQTLKHLIKLLLKKLNIRNEPDFYINSSNYSFNKLKDRSNIIIDDLETGLILDAILKFHEKSNLNQRVS
jgi:glycosyltransferase domain-containing protein